MKNAHAAWEKATELGKAAMDSGDQLQAEQHLVDALRHARQLPAGDPTLVEALGRLALVESSLGNHDEAVAFQQEALDFTVGKWGQVHCEVGACHNGLGLILLQKGDLAAANKALKRAMQILGHPPTPHSVAAGCLLNLGAVAFADKRYDHAKSYLNRALGILQAIKGPRHRDVALALSNLACACQQLGDQEEARELNERAIKIAGTLPLNDHVRALVVANNSRA